MLKSFRAFIIEMFDIILVIFKKIFFVWKYIKIIFFYFLKFIFYIRIAGINNLLAYRSSVQKEKKVYGPFIISITLYIGK